MAKERLQEHIREALAEVEEQRDDAVVYLSTIKVLLDVLARGRALALVADIVGQVLTIARVRASMHRLCTDLESELGMTRRALSDQQQSLRAHEENIRSLTQALVRSNRVKREFLSAVSHELRTPLNAILGYTSIVREGMAGSVTDEQSSLLDRALPNTP